MSMHITYDDRSTLTYHPDCGCVYVVATGRIRHKCREHARFAGSTAAELLDAISGPESVNCDLCGFDHDPVLSCDEWAQEERLARAVPERWS